MRNEVDAVLTEIQAEVAQLMASGVPQHQAHLHETEAAKTDDGGMRFCPGCRLKVLLRRQTALADAIDDDVVLAHKDKSRREEVLLEVKERREVEKVKP